MASKPHVFPNAEGLLLCSRRKKYKDKSEYIVHRESTRGYQYWCKRCVADNKVVWRRENKERNANTKRRYARKKLYGLSDNDYVILGLSQDWKCAVCGIDIDDLNGRDLDIDHDHLTGNIRGLLCGSCNKGLGYFKDN